MFHSLHVELKTALLEAIKNHPGKKDIIIEGSLFGRVARLIDFSTLNSAGLEKLYRLEDALFGLSESQFFVLNGSSLSAQTCPPADTSFERSLRTVLDHLRALRQRFSNSSFCVSLVFLPTLPPRFEERLEREGLVCDEIRVSTLRLDPLPLDRDLLTMDLPSALPSLFLVYHFIDMVFCNMFSIGHSDWTHLRSIAASLCDVVQALRFASFGSITCIGRIARMLGELLHREQWLHEALQAAAIDDAPNAGPVAYSLQLVLIDREVDYVTPLLEQQTYEGALDEFCSVRLGELDVPAKLTAAANKESQMPSKMRLDSSDLIFSQLRCVHLRVIADYIRALSKSNKERSERRKDVKDVGELQRFVSNDLKDLLAQRKLLSYHTSLIEYIFEERINSAGDELANLERSILYGHDVKDSIKLLEDYIILQNNPMQALRLLVLWSLTHGGLPPSQLEHFSQLFIQSYGNEHIGTLENLRQIGCLCEQCGSALHPGESGVSSSSPSASDSEAGYVSSASTRAPALPAAPLFSDVRRLLRLFPTAASNPSARDLEAHMASYELRSPPPSDTAFLFGGIFRPALARLVEIAASSDQAGASPPKAKESLPKLHDVCRKLRLPLMASKAFAEQLRPNPTLPVRIVLVVAVGGCSLSEVAALRSLFTKPQESNANLRTVVLVLTTAVLNARSLLESLATGCLRLPSQTASVSASQTAAGGAPNAPRPPTKSTPFDGYMPREPTFPTGNRAFKRRAASSSAPAASKPAFSPTDSDSNK